MAENKKKPMPKADASAKKADLSARLEAATGNIDRVSQDTVARRTEQKENMKRSARDARARARGSEKQRIADEARAGEITRQRIAELEYAEDYRKKLQKERNRNKEELRRAREAAVLEARAERSKEIQAQLEEERGIAMERAARAEALLGRIAAKNAEKKDAEQESPADLVAEREQPKAEEVREEEAAAPAAEIPEVESDAEEVASVDDDEELTEEESFEYSMDDKVVIDILDEGEGYTVEIDMNDGIHSFETCAVAESETSEAGAVEEKEVVEEKVVGEYPDPKLSPNPVVAAIQTLGKSVYTTSGYRKYLDKSRSTVKEFKRVIANLEQSVSLGNNEDGAATLAIVNAISAAAAVVEIRCDNLRLAVKYGQRNIESTKKELSSDIEFYNSKVAEFATFTGEKLTRLSPDLTARIAEGSGVEVIPELTFGERYIEYNGEYNGERTRSYVINLGTEPPEITEEQRSNANGTYMVKPVIPATTAEKLLEGVHVTDAVAYNLYRKTALKAGKYIEKLIVKAGYDVDIAEENGEKYTKRLERQRLSVNKLIDRLKNKVDDVKDTAYRKTLAALEGKRGAYDKTEKKLELTRTYAEDKERQSALKINRLALRREKLIIAFNTLSAASITGHDEYIEKAKAELLSEMVAYNTAAEECSAVIGVKITPVLANLADDILEGKSCVDIPRIAVLKELKETVGESTRVVGKPVETAAHASCTFIISGGNGNTVKAKKPKSNLRTVHGNFFIGNSAYNGVAGDGSDYADALVTGAVVAGPMMAASGAAIDPGVAAATALAFGTAATAGGGGVLNALSSANQSESNVEADAPVINEASIAEPSYDTETAEAVAMAGVIPTEKSVGEVAEAAQIAEDITVAETEASAADNSEFSFVPGVFGFDDNEITESVDEAPVIEQTPVIEKASEVEKASLEAESVPEESPFIINEVTDEPLETNVAEEAASEEAAAELDAPIEEVSPRRLRKTLRDERGDETVIEEPYTEELINDDREGEIAPAAATQPIDFDEPVDITGEDVNSDKIKLVQLPPPEGMGDGAELPEEEEEAGPVYPGNTINRPDDGFDYEDPDDLSSMPPVIEIDDSADLVDNEILFKPTKRGFKKYANYVHKKISQAKRKRNALLRKKRSEKSVVPKVKLIISILGCQKEVIDWSCNLLSACCDMGKKKLAKRIANALRKELKRYNKYVKEYEKLTDDRLTKASLDIPACILEGEDYQTLPKVKLREFEAPEDGVVFDDGITEIADVENDYEGVTVMTAKELKRRLQNSSSEIDRLHAQLDRKVKEKHDAWGIERSILFAECFYIQKKIIDTLATDLHAACQASAVKSVQSLKKALNYEVRQYNRLVSEYRAVSGNVLTPASGNIAQDIIAGNNYAPVPRVGCVHSTADELSSDIANMSRNSYGVETDELGVAGRAAFRSKVNAQANKDLSLVTKRADYEISMLESERDMLDFRFGKEPSQVRREKRDLAKRIDKVRAMHKQALKYENADNRRYYAVVTANPKTMTLNNKRADRTRIAAIRSKIISLLNERDAVNGKLAALYAGGDDLVSGSVNQSLRRIKNKAAEKAKKKQKSLAKVVRDLPITQNDKNRFYTLMNKKVDALSTLALIKHRLKKEKLHSDDKLVAKRDVKELSAKARAIEKDICDLMSTTKKRINEIESGHSWMIAFFLVILLMVVGVVLYVYFFGDSIANIMNAFSS